MTWKLEVVLLALLFASSSHGFNAGNHVMPKTFSNAWLKQVRSQDPTTAQLMSKFRTFLSTASDASAGVAVATESSDKAKSKSFKKSVKKVDENFDSYTVGQLLEGKVISAKDFGVFMDIGTGTNVLVPRSTLTTSGFELLQALVKDKSSEKLQLEITSKSVINKTLSGRLVSSTYSNKSKQDFSTLQGVDISGKTFNGTVVAAHDFGVFVRIEEYGVEGLIPASKLGANKKSKITSTYQVGSSIKVKVEEFNFDEKKLSFSIEGPRVDVSPLSSLPRERWVQGVVQNVANFGLFVRPAGYEVVGLVHVTRIPRELINILRDREEIATTEGRNPADILEKIFHVGDVVKFRVDSIDGENNRAEFSMLPFLDADGEEEESYDDEAVDDEDEELETYDLAIEEQKGFQAESTLLWWKGAPYFPSRSDSDDDDLEFFDAEEGEEGDDEDDEEQEEEIVPMESDKVIDGSWRRMFETDLQEDADDFTSKELEEDLKELEEEIGDLHDVDMGLIEDSVGVAPDQTMDSLASHLQIEKVKEEVLLSIQMFQESSGSAKEFVNRIKTIKAQEKSEFDELLREVEATIVDEASAEAAAPVAETSDIEIEIEEEVMV